MGGSISHKMTPRATERRHRAICGPEVDRPSLEVLMLCTSLTGALRAIRALTVEFVLSHLALCIPLRILKKVDCFTLYVKRCTATIEAVGHVWFLMANKIGRNPLRDVSVL